MTQIINVSALLAVNYNGQNNFLIRVLYPLKKTLDMKPITRWELEGQDHDVWAIL